MPRPRRPRPGRLPDYDPADRLDRQGRLPEHLLDLEPAGRETLRERVAGERLERLTILRDAVRERIAAHERSSLLDLGDQPRQAYWQGRREVQALVGQTLGLDEGVVQAPRQPRVGTRQLLSEDQGVHDGKDPGL